MPRFLRAAAFCAILLAPATALAQASGTESPGSGQPGAPIPTYPAPGVTSKQLVRNLACNGGVAIDRSWTSVASAAKTIAVSNPARSALLFQVPSTLTGGLWVSWTGTAAPNALGSYFFAAGTVLEALPSSQIGAGAISFYANTASVVVPATEC